MAPKQYNHSSNACSSKKALRVTYEHITFGEKKNVVKFDPKAQLNYEYVSKYSATSIMFNICVGGFGTFTLTVFTYYCTRNYYRLKK